MTTSSRFGKSLEGNVAGTSLKDAFSEAPGAGQRDVFSGALELAENVDGSGNAGTPTAEIVISELNFTGLGGHVEHAWVVNPGSATPNDDFAIRAVTVNGETRFYLVYTGSNAGDLEAGDLHNLQVRYAARHPQDAVIANGFTGQQGVDKDGVEGGEVFAYDAAVWDGTHTPPAEQGGAWRVAVSIGTQNGVENIYTGPNGAAQAVTHNAALTFEIANFADAEEGTFTRYLVVQADGTAAFVEEVGEHYLLGTLTYSIAGDAGEGEVTVDSFVRNTGEAVANGGRKALWFTGQHLVDADGQPGGATFAYDQALFGNGPVDVEQVIVLDDDLGADLADDGNDFTQNDGDNTVDNDLRYSFTISVGEGNIYHGATGQAQAVQDGDVVLTTDTSGVYYLVVQTADGAVSFMNKAGWDAADKAAHVLLGTLSVDVKEPAAETTATFTQNTGESVENGTRKATGPVTLANQGGANDFTGWQFVDKDGVPGGESFAFNDAAWTGLEIPAAANDQFTFTAADSDAGTAAGSW